MRKNFVSIIAVITASVLLLTGCSTDETVLPEPSMAPNEIISRINAQPAAISSFTATGSIFVETPQMSQNAGFDLAVKKPDSLLITISGPFGITLGQGLFTRATFVAYSALNNTVYQGNSGAGMQSLPFFAGIDINVMIDALSGIRRFDDTFGEPDSFTVGTHSYIFTFRSNPRTTKFFVEARSHLITRVITYRADETILWEEQYTYSGTSAGQWQPSSVKVTIPDRTMSMELIYDEILFNSALPEFSIGYPDDATRIIID